MRITNEYSNAWLHAYIIQIMNVYEGNGKTIFMR